MASSNCWSVHLPHFEILTCLLTMPPPYIVFVAKWHYCYVTLMVGIVC
jgi:hypothetical protein